MRHLNVHLIVIAFIGISCASETLIEPAANVVVESSLTSGSVSAVEKNSDRTQGMSDVSSIRIGRVRVLVSRMILRPDTTANSVNDEKVKLEPFLYSADSTGARVIASVSMLLGSYQSIKWEIHRFSTSEVPNYSNDTTFRDFVDGNRYTVLLEGTLDRSGVREPFTYRSNVTANIKIDFSPSIVVRDDTPVTLSLVFDVSKAFKDNGVILDPTDARNESKIDNNIKDAFKANKR